MFVEREKEGRGGSTYRVIIWVELCIGELCRLCEKGEEGERVALYIKIYYNFFGCLVFFIFVRC